MTTMYLWKLTKLVIFWLSINAGLQTHAFKDQVRRHSREDKSSIHDQAFEEGSDRYIFNFDDRIITKTTMITTEQILQNNIDAQKKKKEDREEMTENPILTASVPGPNGSYITRMNEFDDRLDRIEQNQTDVPIKRSDDLDISRGVDYTCGVSGMQYQCDVMCLEENGNIVCEISSCIGKYRCLSGRYISLSQLHDGKKDCWYNDDEELCTRFHDHRYMSICISIIIDCKTLTPKTAKTVNPFRTDSILADIVNCTYFNRTVISHLTVRNCSLSEMTSVIKLCQNASCSKVLGFDAWNVDLSNDISELITELPSVRKLRLSGSRIASLPVGGFNGLDLDLLDLSSNSISFIPKGVFAGQRILTLDLSSNKIASLHVGIFPISLFYLDLSSNMISSLPVDVFTGNYLYNLDLSFNRITSLPNGVFTGQDLRNLDLSFNSISSISAGVFAGLHLVWLNLSHNILSTLPVGVFNGLPLDTLDLSSNAISILPVGVFNELPLETLDLSSNSISLLSVGVFDNLPLVTLDLSSNSISHLLEGVFNGLLLNDLDLSSNAMLSLPVDVFNRLPLYRLDLSSNLISSLPLGVFNGLPLHTLDLSSNKMAFLSVGIFNGLVSTALMKVSVTRGARNRLKYLNFSANELSSFPVDIFNNLSLNVLDLSSNKIQTLQRSACRGLRSKYLSLANNGMVHVQDGSFEGVVKLRVLNLNQNELKVTEHMFKGLQSLTHLFVDTYMLCCVRPKNVPREHCLGTHDIRSCINKIDVLDVSVRRCSAPRNAISTCSSIIGSMELRVFLWTIGLTALVGNLAVIVYRLIIDKQNLKKSYSIFVLNLSLSDVLMGVYMLIIGTADIMYRGVYAWNDEKWRYSTLCATAGILSTVSSEMSTFVILIISIDRFIVIVFPFTQYRITWRQAICVSTALWGIAFTLAIIPQVTLHSYFKTGFYSKSGVCLALPLTDDTEGVEYSMSVFVGLNSFIFLITMVGYIGMYRSIARSNVANSQTRRRDIAVAKTLFLVVATDFCCWIPIGVMGILAQAGIPTPQDIYSWIMIFVLPINSAINPFIYTFIYAWRKWKQPRQTQ